MNHLNAASLASLLMAADMPRYGARRINPTQKGKRTKAQKQHAKAKKAEKQARKRNRKRK